MARRMLTTPGGPAIIGQRTLHAMIAIRREKFIPDLYPRVLITQRNRDALREPMPDTFDWLEVVADDNAVELPARVAGARSLDVDTLRGALAHQAGVVLIDGPIKERAKLSFFKCEGALSMLVWAHREGKLTAVKPMVKAWTALGFEDVLPPPEALDALWTALGKLEDA